MKWTKITIETITDAVDMISYTLGELGVEGIEVEDKIPLTEEEKQAMYIDILPTLPPDDGIALVSCYVRTAEDGEEEKSTYNSGIILKDSQNVNFNTKTLEDILAEIRTELDELRTYMEIGTGKITSSTVEEKDWINNWKDFFHAFRVGDLLIKPTWIPFEEIPDYRPGEDCIEIDPGTAFGTGAHETTKLCIEHLQSVFREQINGEEKSIRRVLDAGCGSGILSILSAKYGAESVLGVDIDPKAVEISIENSDINHINKNNIEFRVCNLLEEELELEPVDLVVANILADVIIPLTPRIKPYLKKDGYYIVSGIIDTKEEAIRQTLEEEGFMVLSVTKMKEWVSFLAKIQD